MRSFSPRAARRWIREGNYQPGKTSVRSSLSLSPRSLAERKICPDIYTHIYVSRRAASASLWPFRFNRRADEFLFRVVGARTNIMRISRAIRKALDYGGIDRYRRGELIMRTNGIVAIESVYILANLNDPRKSTFFFWFQSVLTTFWIATR